MITFDPMVSDCIIKRGVHAYFTHSDMPLPISANKIVVFSGAGISAESGIKTFRDHDGLWEKRDPMKIASVEAWENTPEAVIDFHNERLIEVEKAEPNAAHLALAQLEEFFEVVIITQNVDDLHERAGSSKVMHLHGSVTEVYTDGDPSSVVKRGFEPLSYETHSKDKQLRPNIVLFGEPINHHDEALEHLQTAARVLVVGTSLAVQPAAGMLKKTRFRAERVIVSLEVDNKPFGFDFMRGEAGELVPFLANRWINEGPKKLT